MFTKWGGEDIVLSTEGPSADLWRGECTDCTQTFWRFNNRLQYFCLGPLLHCSWITFWSTFHPQACTVELQMKDVQLYIYKRFVLYEWILGFKLWLYFEENWFWDFSENEGWRNLLDFTYDYFQNISDIKSNISTNDRHDNKPNHNNKHINIQHNKHKNILAQQWF